MLAILTYHLSTVLLLLIVSAAAVTDFRRHRIPNLLSLGGAGLGLALQTWVVGLNGLVDALGGLCVGLGLLLPFYIGRGMGAGDVKLMAAVGTFLGFRDTFLAVAATLAAGAIIAIGILIFRRGLAPLLGRYFLTAKCLLTSGQLIYIPAAVHDPSRARFAYGVAVAAGTFFTLWYLDGLAPIAFAPIYVRQNYF